jgi:hypothetical protein
VRCLRICGNITGRVGGEHASMLACEAAKEALGGSMTR